MRSAKTLAVRTLLCDEANVTVPWLTPVRQHRIYVVQSMQQTNGLGSSPELFRGSAKENNKKG